MQRSPRPSREALEALVRWLALPYTNRPPIFALKDWKGNPLRSNEELKETWEAVIGPLDAEAPGSWRQCPTCESFVPVTEEEI